jgi:hypothetical protein
VCDLCGAKIWHPSGSTVQPMPRSAATNPAGMFTSCLFNSLNGRLIFASSGAFGMRDPDGEREQAIGHHQR